MRQGYHLLPGESASLPSRASKPRTARLTVTICAASEAKPAQAHREPFPGSEHLRGGKRKLDSRPAHSARAPKHHSPSYHAWTTIAYIQILDSIYGDLPMSRLKMNAKMEYEYLDNFKILQKAFTKHRIQKVSTPQADRVQAYAGYGCFSWQMSCGARGRCLSCVPCPHSLSAGCSDLSGSLTSSRFPSSASSSARCRTTSSSCSG